MNSQDEIDSSANARPSDGVLCVNRLSVMA